MTSEPAGTFTPHPRVVAKALRRSSLVDPFLCCRYSFSPYMACGHGCAYCDGRAERYWVEGDFERDIVTRTNIADVLREELSRLRERAPAAIGSGISDAYQPLEEQQGLMQDCAFVLADFRFPVTLLTKSSLVRRDIDIWEGVNRASSFILNLSIATLDESVRRRFEPRASSIEERLDTIRAFRARGIAVGVMAMPLLPFIGDAEADLRALLVAAKDAGAAFVTAAGLTLRPGRQKEFFLSRLAAAYPSLMPRYEEIYAEQRASGASTKNYQGQLANRIARACRAANLPPLLPHALYRGRLPLYDEVYLLLRHMEDLYEARGVPISELKRAEGRYTHWLTARKKVFARRRSQRQEDLEEEARAAFDGDEGVALLGNAKLAAFLRSVARDRRILDYTTLSLSES
jgi:DNA repair photolyase